ncbi:inositol monophosphatase [bacterium]|nr:inositol monophosphatase [bacterium]
MINKIEKLLELSKNTARIALDKLVWLDDEDEKRYSFDEDIAREAKAVADIIIENVILEQLIPTGIDILSEESGAISGDGNSTLKFIIDPIDGTINFVRGISKCSVSIALFDGDKPLFGVIASYPDCVIAWGGNGIGSFLENTKLKVSTIYDLNKGVLCTGFPSRFKFDTQSILLQVELMSKFGKTRMLGSASQSLLQVAKGAVECYSEKDIMLWDVAAGIAIVEGSGGRVLTTQGSSDFSLDVIACNCVNATNVINFKK